MTEANITGYRFAGDIEIRSLLFVTSDSQAIDVSSLIVELNIYQSISEHYLQCDIVFNDALRLIHNIANGFTGSEMLVVSFRNKTDKDDIEFNDYVFGLYELSDRQHLDNDEIYLVSGVSIEAYSSTVQKISRAYGKQGGSTISDMIATITDEFILNDAAKTIYEQISDSLPFNVEKQIDIEESSGLHQLIVPDLSVDGTIDFLIAEADSNDHIPLFVYYEDSTGFKFYNISTLVNEESTETYSYFPFNYDTNDLDHEYDFTRIMSFAIIKQTNIIENAQKGLFKSTTTSIDIHKKQFNTTTFDYTKRNNEFAKLNPTVILGEVKSNNPLGFTMFTRLNQDSSDPYYGNENHFPKRMDQFISAKTSYKRHIFNTIIEVTVPGNSNLTVGKIVTLNFPILNDIDDSENIVDKYLSGKYLITKLRHKLAGKEDAGFLTIFEATKDGAVE